jgi:hypothetical protein
MDREPTPVIELQDDEFEQVASPVWAEEERATGFVVTFLERVADKRVLGSMSHVLVGDAMLAS